MSASPAKKRTRGSSIDETIQHIIQIENWKLDYSFGLSLLKLNPPEFSDDRLLMLEGPIIEPKKITAKRGKILCFPNATLIGLERPWIDPTKETPLKVGMVYYRGKEYTASFSFPGDMLPVIVQMLVAGKYRHVTLRASAKGPEVFSFTFLDIHGDPEGKLSLAPR